MLPIWKRRQRNWISIAPQQCRKQQEWISSKNNGVCKEDESDNLQTIQGKAGPKGCRAVGHKTAHARCADNSGLAACPAPGSAALQPWWTTSASEYFAAERHFLQDFYIWTKAFCTFHLSLQSCNEFVVKILNYIQHWKKIHSLKQFSCISLECWCYQGDCVAERRAGIHWVSVLGLVACKVALTAFTPFQNRPCSSGSLTLLHVCLCLS